MGQAKLLSQIAKSFIIMVRNLMRADDREESQEKRSVLSVSLDMDGLVNEPLEIRELSAMKSRPRCISCLRTRKWAQDELGTPAER